MLCDVMELSIPHRDLDFSCFLVPLSPPLHKKYSHTKCHMISLGLLQGSLKKTGLLQRC